MKLLKYLLISGLLVCMACPGMAQYDYPGESVEKQEVQKKIKPEIASRFFFSPRIGLSIWNSGAYFEIAPILGYRFTNRFWLGAGPEYMFFKSGAYQTSVYGATSFAYFALLDNIDEVINLGVRSIFLYLEDEVLSIQPYKEPRDWYNLVLGGIGARMPIGERMGISIIIVWGLNKPTELLYSSPELRVMYDF